jgi:hypothetical protein
MLLISLRWADSVLGGSGVGELQLHAFYARTPLTDYVDL